jgi:hypothetical protein
MRPSFEIVCRYGNWAYMNAPQNVPVRHVCQSVVDGTAILQVSHKNGYVVIRIRPGVATGSGTEKDDICNPAGHGAFDFAAKCPKVRNGPARQHFRQRA